MTKIVLVLTTNSKWYGSSAFYHFLNWRISPIWQKWLANCCFCHEGPQTTSLCHQNFYFFQNTTLSLPPVPRMHKARDYKVLELWQHIHVCKKSTGLLPVSPSVSSYGSVSVFHHPLSYSHISIWQLRILSVSYFYMTVEREDCVCVICILFLL